MISTLAFAVRAIVTFILLLLLVLSLFGPIGTVEMALLVAISLAGAWVLGFALRRAGRRSPAGLA